MLLFNSVGQCQILPMLMQNKGYLIWEKKWNMSYNPKGRDFQLVGQK
jgi:hypothetical protein